MTIQVALRLSEDLVAYLDGEVEAGRARSRTEVVSRALRDTRRQERTARDAAIYVQIEAEGGDELSTPEDAEWTERNAAQAWAHLDDTDWSYLRDRVISWGESRT